MSCEGSGSTFLWIATLFVVFVCPLITLLLAATHKSKKKVDLEQTKTD